MRGQALMLQKSGAEGFPLHRDRYLEPASPVLHIQNLAVHDSDGLKVFLDRLHKAHTSCNN